MSYSLLRSQSWASAYVQGLPTSAFTGLEPILTTASMVQALAMSAPLVYPWNRKEATPITTIADQQDYTVTVSDFGFLETASLTDSTGKIWQIDDILNDQPLAKSTTSARPNAISVFTQVYGTSFTVRFSAVPQEIYTLNLVYQKAPVLFAALSDLWTLPDNMISVFNNLLLGELFQVADDPRAGQYRQRGVAGLLSFQQGMEEEDKATFMQLYLNQGAAAVSQQSATQQGNAGRAV